METFPPEQPDAREFPDDFRYEKPDM